MTSSKLAQYHTQFKKFQAQGEWLLAWQLARNWTHASLPAAQQAGIYAHAAQCSKQLKELARADKEWQQALSLDPHHPSTVLAYADHLSQQGQITVAVNLLEQAIRQHPLHAVLHNQLAVHYMNAARFQEVPPLLWPLDEQGHANAHTLTLLGVVHAMHSMYEPALGYFERIKNLPDAPLHADYYNNLGMINKELNRFEAACEHFKTALQLDPRHTALSNLLLVLNYITPQQPETYLHHARQFGTFANEGVHAFASYSGTREADRPLRVGFISGDLYSHPVGFFFSNVITALQAVAGPNLFIAGYMNRTVVDETSEHIRQQCHLWRVFSHESAAQVAQTIHADAIDILVDLSGHTGFSRLNSLAYKPAPVQMSWLGYFASTGLPQVDYFLADPITLPPEFEPHFTEKIWRLPHTRLCFTPPAQAPEVGPLPALRNGHLTLGCTNALIKLNDGVIATWSKILHALPTAVLLLKAKELGYGPAAQSLLQKFESHGIDPQRITLEGPSERQAYFSVYQRIDFLLDPFPFPGGTTTAEALWMGVPVLSLAGNTFLARQGAGLLHNVGLPDWVACDEDDYVRKAVAKAGDLPALAHTRMHLRQQLPHTPVYNAQQFATDLHACLRGMWQAHVGQTATA